MHHEEYRDGAPKHRSDGNSHLNLNMTKIYLNFSLFALPCENTLGM